MKFEQRMQQRISKRFSARRSLACLAEGLERRVLLNGALAFATPQTFAAGVRPQSVVVADVNHDAIPDIVFVNSGDNDVAVMLGNGDGTFQAQQTFQAQIGSSPTSVAVGDINGDGKPDLVVANTFYNSVGVLLGNGDGTFQPEASFSTGGSTTTSVAIALVDGDGNPDLVTANGVYGATVLLGNGDGSFGFPQTVPVGVSEAVTKTVNVVDLNGDGKPDLIATQPASNSLSVLLGNGDGTFQMQQTYATDVGPDGVVVADVNGDGKLDLVVSNTISGVISVLLGNGDGTFQAQTTFDAGSTPKMPSVADVNGDGIPDIIVANTYNDISVLLGVGDGTFQLPLPFASGTAFSSYNVAAADVTGDGKLDLVVANDDTLGSGPGSISVLVNTTSFQSTPTVSLMASANPITTADTVTLTATVAPPIVGGTTPTGSVTFFSNGVSLGTSNVQSDMTATLLAGPLIKGIDTLTASYGGDAKYVATVSLPITETVNSGAKTIPSAKIGGLDPTFASGGLAAHDVGLDSTSDLLLQPDGKSVIIGTDGTSPPMNIGVARYNADGSLDTTFANGSGVVDTSISGDDQSRAGFLLPDGDILVAATSTTLSSGQPAGSQFALIEYTPAGALDTTFGAGKGYVLTSFSSVVGTLSNDVAHAIRVTAAGEIFVAGSSDAGGHGTDFAIAAYNPDGTPATSFGGTGKVLLDFTGGNDSINALALQPKGSILAAGFTTDPGSGIESVALARFLPTGALDTHFGVKGKAVTGVGGVADAASSIAITPKTGKIVVGGFSATGSAAAGTLSSDFLLLRYTTAGKLDRSFNNSGVVITNFNQPAAVTSVITEADGTIIATGKATASLSAINPAALELAVAQYKSNGALDTTFNGTGEATFDLNNVVPQSLTSAVDSRPQPASLVAFDATSDLMQQLNELTQSVQGVGAITDGGILLDVGNSNGSTVEAAVVTTGIDLAAALLSTLPTAVVGGAKGTITVQIKESGNQTFTGTVSVQLFATATQDITGQTPFQSIPEKLSLKQNKTKTVRLTFAFPGSLPDGNYFVEANVDTGAVRDLDPANNVAPTSAVVDIAKPFVDLTGSGLVAPVFAGSKPVSVAFTATNNGNIPTPKTATSVQFLASTDGTLTNAISITTQPFRPNLKASSSHVFKVKLALLTTPPTGTYKLLILLDPGNVFNDSNTSNNLIVSGNTFVVG